MANEYRSKSGAEREDERSKKERERDERKDIYGTNTPNAEERKAYEREERRRQVIENGIAQGIPEEEIADYADRALGLSGSATPRLVSPTSTPTVATSLKAPAASPSPSSTSKTTTIR